MEVSVDWYAASFLGVDEKPVRGWLMRHVDSLSEGGGHYGYTRCSRGRGVSLYEGGREGMGVYLQLSGEGCTTVGSGADFEGWPQEFVSLRRYGAKETRIDIAFDAFGCEVTVQSIRDALLAGRFRSVWREWSDWSSAGRSGTIAESVYLGSISSDVSLLVYDKTLERRSKGVDVADGWLRFELRYKRERAVQIAARVIENGGLSCCLPLLRELVEFHEPGGDSNASRRETAVWWRELTGGVVREKLLLDKREVDYNRAVAAFRRRHGKTVAMLVRAAEAAGRSGLVTEDFLRECEQKFSDSDILKLRLLIKSAVVGGAVDSGGRVTGGGYLW